MKLKILTMMLCVALLSACTKQAESEAPQIDYKAQFEESDRKIGEFLDQLDNPNTPQEVKVKILCHDYPDVYKKPLYTTNFTEPLSYQDSAFLKLPKFP
ncbi:hypothetical protein MHJ28_16340, partial [Acinetobacter baumannii]|nr:hypothetical protein [Acinetobacter baumannii]